MKLAKGRECESVTGTWFDYFKKVTTPEFDDAVCAKFDKLLVTMYGDFFDRTLSPEKGELLSLGAGFGLTEIPLARKGYKVIGIDNDKQVLEVLERNAKKYAMGNLKSKYGDLYKDFQNEFAGKDIQACVSFGVLEHFTREYLDELVRKQFEISPLLVCMIPIGTPETLKSFKAEDKPTGNVDENGIYRNFWTSDYWEKEIFGRCHVIDKCYPVNHSSFGKIEMAAFAVRK